MTVLAPTLYDLPTMADALATDGLPVDGEYPCPCCARPPMPAGGLVDTVDLPGDLPRFVCHTCASGAYREAVAEAEAMAALAAGPDWSAVRAKRNLLLANCDWTLLPDVSLAPEVASAWTVYRQALRDITTAFPSPAVVDWPSPPSQA